METNPNAPGERPLPASHFKALNDGSWPGAAVPSGTAGNHLAMTLIDPQPPAENGSSREADSGPGVSLATTLGISSFGGMPRSEGRVRESS